ncbi:MAG: twin-arginine translocase TatA/TatE family subunit [Thermodesulfobacteriota bacterium]|nr:twin-arginine translocase TatA/TatE family subunit [Thermodesulfobacteriota bacterium]MEE2975472.1 twin-arginine translocase TatA/TatE family subunit [Thermodesulfobacteriota bacterium]|tara:strand:- start:503 stop:688 length:186 start_codon:yes stop_codon:yes gene_type:complete
MIGNIGLTELIIILLIVLLIFGPQKLGDIGSSLGKGISGFKKAMKDENSKEDDSENKKEEN